MSYFKDLKLDSPEYDNAEVLDSRYFTKGCYIAKSIYDSIEGYYSFEKYMTYPSSLSTSGYDLVVYFFY